ncbi:MAG: FtsX-like permease family protein [Bryobacterales bacterium]
MGSAREVGLLLASGLTTGQIRKLLVTEGALVAAVGCLIGLPLAVAYWRADGLRLAHLVERGGGWFVSGVGGDPAEPRHRRPERIAP